jgi:hypothetical protein
VALYVYGYAGGNQLSVKKNGGAAGGLLQQQLNLNLASK